MQDKLTAEMFSIELESILSYWMKYSIDQANGGFYGSVDNDNVANEQAVKGSVLNARILWSFSAAFNLTKNPAYLAIAKRSAAYILAYFIDKEYGGVYWSVDCKGKPLETKKQVYAIAFTIYGLSEFYMASQNEAAIITAKQLYKVIETFSHDKEKGGYLEALTREWDVIDDLRLSNKDANEKKTMNTHLHILEAYTNLYRIWPEVTLRSKIKELIGTFQNKILDKNTAHLQLFFDEDWASKSTIVSYGHDIEASWLLLEAAEVLEDDPMILPIKKLAVEIAFASAEGLDKDGSMLYETEPDHQKTINEKHWWVQAEAVVGFYNAWQVSGEKQFLDYSLAAWNFIQQYIIDHKKGEWFWGVTENNTVMQGFDKAGFWKCPYHNSRACIEMIKRLTTTPNSNV
jgi:mannobiose 2-epimerase